jgi:hypothetical protein
MENHFKTLKYLLHPWFVCDCQYNLIIGHTRTKARRKVTKLTLKSNVSSSHTFHNNAKSSFETFSIDLRQTYYAQLYIKKDQMTFKDYLTTLGTVILFWLDLCNRLVDFDGNWFYRSFEAFSLPSFQVVTMISSLFYFRIRSGDLGGISVCTTSRDGL